MAVDEERMMILQDRSVPSFFGNHFDVNLSNLMSNIKSQQNWKKINNDNAHEFCSLCFPPAQGSLQLIKSVNLRLRFYFI